MTVAHTSALERTRLEAIRALLEEVFAGRFTEEDFEHTLGGMHAMVWEGGELVAHASVVMRRMLHRGRALRCGYVEGVGVRSDRRRQGHGGAVMDAVGEVIRGAYELGALGATDEGAFLYASRGWRRWTGTAAVLAPDGPRPTPHQSIYVLPVSAELDPDGELACDWRDGAVW